MTRLHGPADACAAWPGGSTTAAGSRDALALRGTIAAGARRPCSVAMPSMTHSAMFPVPANAAPTLRSGRCTVDRLERHR